MSLLEQAKTCQQRETNKAYNDEEVELAVAWMQDVVSSSQVQKVTGIQVKATGVYQWAMPRVKHGIKKGIVTLVYNK